MNEVFYGIGDFFESLFPIVEKLGNTPNFMLIIICFGAIIAWLSRMARYNKEAKESGTLK